MSGKEYNVRIAFESTRGYPMRLMIDRSAAKVMKSGESHETRLSEGMHEVMISVSIRKKPVMLDLRSDSLISIRVEDVFKAIDVEISGME